MISGHGTGIKGIQYDMPYYGQEITWPQWFEQVARMLQGKQCAMNAPTTQLACHGTADEVSQMVARVHRRHPAAHDRLRHAGLRNRLFLAGGERQGHDRYGPIPARVCMNDRSAGRRSRSPSRPGRSAAHDGRGPQGAPAASIIRMVEQYVDRVLARRSGPRGVYTIREVEDQNPGSTATLQGCPPFEGQIAGFLKPARRVAVFVVDHRRRDRAHGRTQRWSRGPRWKATPSTPSARPPPMPPPMPWPTMCCGTTAEPGRSGHPAFQPRLLRDGPGTAENALLHRGCQPHRGRTAAHHDHAADQERLGPDRHRQQESIAAHGIPCEYCKMTSCRMRR